eukprot:5361069-Ditylum_brightwellii.AAC.1
MKGDQTPQPRTQWIKDIAPHIHKWQENRQVSMIVDANSGIKNAIFRNFVAEVGLCDVIGATYGQKCKCSMMASTQTTNAYTAI